VERLLLEAQQARRRMVEGTLPWVIHWARDYERSGLEAIDVIQEGSIGLMRAVDGFDYTGGQRFYAHAWWWVRQAITRAIAEQSAAVRLPLHVQETVVQFRHASETLWEELGRYPSLIEVAERLGYLAAEDAAAISEASAAGRPLEPWVKRRLSSAIAKVTRLVALAQGTLSLDVVIDEEVLQGDGYLKRLLGVAGVSRDEARGRCIGDLVPWEPVEDPLAANELADLQELIRELLHSLSERQQEALEVRFGLLDGQYRTLEEVGRILGVTREGVRQREAQALRRLGHPKVSRQLRDYWY